GYLSSFENICNHISPSACGLKRSFNFVYHQEGVKQNLEHSNKVGVQPSSHLFRQDIDRYMSKVAIKYGATLLENTLITDFNIDKNGVRVEVESGDIFNANFLVDASGYKSPISQKFNLRESPTRLKTHSRSIFTHMVDVKRYDDCVKSKADGLPWYKGTLHHIFDGGWMWVIPFNNHEKSNNSICSVGVNFDCRRHPKTETSPEEEFKNFLARFPEIAIQFENAKPVRNWVSTGRLQYSSYSYTGERFYQLPHATGFVDALYSFGLVNSCTIIIPLVSRIINALNTGDYSRDNFIEIENLQKKLFDYNDNLVNCSYISFRDFNLWDAWRRIWILGSFMRQTKAGLRNRLKIAAGKEKELVKLNNSLNSLDNLTPSYEGLGDDFFSKATSIVEDVEKGLVSSHEATKKLMSLIESIDFLPQNFWNMGDFTEKDIDIESDFFKAEFSRFLSWVKKSKKPQVKKYFDYDIEDLIAATKLTTVKK
ncbi:MAG: tryptophan 7-halogenase, partial [Cyanobacteria bacterium J06639_18]